MKGENWSKTTIIREPLPDVISCKQCGFYERAEKQLQNVNRCPKCNSNQVYLSYSKERYAEHLKWRTY